MLNKEDKAFWKKLLIKSFVVLGYTFFISLVGFKLADAINLIAIFISSFIGAGVYFFTELMKYYQVQPEKKVLNGTYTFMF